MAGDKDLKKAPEGAKEQVKEVPSNATQDELKKLRHEVETGRLSKNPDDYNHPETKLEKDDTLEKVLEKIFSQKGGKVPKGSVERIQVALTNIGLDLEKLKKENGIDSWKVEKGKLIFMATKEGGKKEIFLMPLLPWKALNEKIETMEEMKHNYDLGVHDGSPSAGEKVATVEGSVDATPFGKKLEKPQWYNKKIEAATWLLDLYGKDKNRFDTDTQKLIASYEAKLKALQGQKGKTPQQIRADFESKYSSDEIIGSEGIYNFVLAFQRVLDAYGDDPTKLEKSGATIRLVIGKSMKSRDERYVKATTAAGGNLPDEGGKVVIPGKEPGGGEEGTEDYRDTELLGEHLAVRGAAGTLLPSSEKFNEQINTDVASKELLASYQKNGTKALVEGLKKIPEEQRQVVLEAIFSKLGEDDPQKAFLLMKEIIKYEKGDQEKAVYEGLKENFEKAPNENEKNFWKMQMLLFETSQAGDMDEKGNLRLSYNQSQNKMREAYQLIAKINGDTLPDELKEMFKQQKEYLETSLRQGMSVDMLDTFVGFADNIFQNDEENMEDLEEMKQKSREEIAEAISGGIDYDEDVYVSIKHVVEAIRLACTYQYPKDVAEGKKIDNPIKYYNDEIRSGRLTEIKLDEGVSVPVNDILQDTPKIMTGSIKLDELFVAKESEFDLFDQYQSGSESLDETTVWKLWAAWQPVWSKEQRLAGAKGGFEFMPSFMQTEGGLIKASDAYFPAGGEIAKFMVNEGKEMGTIEKLQMEKLLYLMAAKNYDEARALCIQILEDKLAAHKKIEQDELLQKANEEEKKYGEKVSAQVRIQLEKQNINSAALAAQKIERPGGGFYTDISDYIHDRVKMAMRERARIKMQGDIADDLTNEETKGLTAYEAFAHDMLQTLNGNNLGSLGMSAETADVVIEIAKMVVEIVVIEVATWGAGTYLAAAAGAARAGTLAAEGAAIAARAGNISVRMAEVGTNLARISRVERMMIEAGRTSRLAGVLGGRAGAPIRYLYEGNTALARGLRTYLHGATFVEAQSLMHGRPVNPFSIKGQTEIAMAASTMYALGKLNQISRGATAGARMAEEGALQGGFTRGAYEGFQQGGWRGALRGMRGRGGWRALPGVRQLNQGSMHLGRLSRRLAASTTVGGRLGSAAFTGVEITAEITALHYLADYQQDAEILLGKYVFKDSGLLTEDEKKAMKDPNTWRTLAHTAGVVLGLRTWRYAGARIGGRPEVPGGGKLLPEAPGPKGLLPEAPGVRGLLMAHNAEPLVARDVELLRQYFRVGIKENISLYESQKPRYQAKIQQAVEGLRAGIYSRAEAESIIRNAFDIPANETIKPEEWSKKVNDKVEALRAKDPALAGELAKLGEQAKRMFYEKPVTETIDELAVRMNEAEGTAKQAASENDLTTARQAAKQAEALMDDAGEVMKKAGSKVTPEHGRKFEEIKAKALEARIAATECALLGNYERGARTTAEALEQYLQKTAEQRGWSREDTQAVRESILLKMEFGGEGGKPIVTAGKELTDLFESIGGAKAGPARAPKQYSEADLTKDIPNMTRLGQKLAEYHPARSSIEARDMLAGRLDMIISRLENGQYKPAQVEQIIRQVFNVPKDATLRVSNLRGMKEIKQAFLVRYLGAEFKGFEGDVQPIAAKVNRMLDLCQENLSAQPKLVAAERAASDAENQQQPAKAGEPKAKLKTAEELLKEVKAAKQKAPEINPTPKFIESLRGMVMGYGTYGGRKFAGNTEFQGRWDKVIKILEKMPAGHAPTAAEIKDAGRAYVELKEWVFANGGEADFKVGANYELCEKELYAST